MPEPRDGDAPMAGTYARVIALQAAVLALLWAAGRYFGSS